MCSSAKCRVMKAMEALILLHIKTPISHFFSFSDLFCAGDRPVECSSILGGACRSLFFLGLSLNGKRQVVTVWRHNFHEKIQQGHVTKLGGVGRRWNGTRGGQSGRLPGDVTAELQHELGKAESSCQGDLMRSSPSRMGGLPTSRLKAQTDRFEGHRGQRDSWGREGS